MGKVCPMLQYTDKPIRLAEAVRLAGVPLTARHIARLVRQGRVKAERIGGLWYTTPAQINAALRVDAVQP